MCVPFHLSISFVHSAVVEEVHLSTPFQLKIRLSLLSCFSHSDILCVFRNNGYLCRQAKRAPAHPDCRTVQWKTMCCRNVRNCAIVHCASADGKYKRTQGCNSTMEENLSMQKDNRRELADAIVK